ncbi:uncharacterized protein A1O9_11336 [Exophiala aquamarina CBS 119918]|uniref:histidine kinase n=1 Tax=Exophiala aquamarina CBS 119918 TaxID=1182545 RepID=A0A072NX98_9EURO|nr:uncharacterized protein A1O9_11336 [Exophiala aquamarina CBS 119918]KEF52494.1 hypothetical protein A1O9_11336 [Exophiala aquamarina CBS 119918]
MTKPALNAFFPTANAVGISRESHRPPERPTEIAPILDKGKSCRPLLEYDEALRLSSFGDGAPATAESFAPPQPETFNDPYLYPFLARNECLRLTLLWYYTRSITNNDALMSKLQGILGIVQKFMGWEFAIIGMVEEAVFTRVAAINMPVALLPRRESPCSHTINQEPGTVFSITNLEEDWRFRSSPQVTAGGLRSYAGTQLRIRIDTGEEAALGSLCIASNTVQKPLTQEQKAALVRFADMITGELVSTQRQNRIREKERKMELLMQLKEERHVVEPQLRAKLDDLIKSFYPEASISTQTSSEQLICLQDGAKIHFSDVKAGLWEDTGFINELIKTGNHSRLSSSQTVRAIVSKCGSSDMFLVVASCDIQHVFDDYDAWFIEGCSQIITDFIHRQDLQEALLAKEEFLRGITHQLRTPIHGVLASSELLAEVLSSPNLSITGQETSINESALTHLGTIQASGSLLMATVNDLLKFNTWSRNKAEELKPTSYDLYCIEKDIMDRLRESMAEPLRPEVPIAFVVQLARERSLVEIDTVILQDALQPLIVNAIQATTCGNVTVQVLTQAESSALHIDIVDTGSGIPSSDRTRIFQPFEKGSIHANGVGLGLTLAVKAAHLLGGKIDLISSEIGTGSHFRVEFPSLIFTDRETSSEMPSERKALTPITDSSQDLSGAGLQLTTYGIESNAISSFPSLSINPHTDQKRSLTPRALLVDDNAINLKVLRMYCEKRGIPYLLATNGQEAIDQFNAASESKANRINLVLMDLQMPICGGLEACTSIRAIEAEKSLPPSTVFMVTGQDSPSDRSLSLEAGSDEFLVKPVSLKLLDKHLARYQFR